MVLEGYAPGGQAGSSSLIENFFGFPAGISGGELTFSAQLQAYRFGAKFSTPAQALSLELSDGEHRASWKSRAAAPLFWLSASSLRRARTTIVWKLRGARTSRAPAFTTLPRRAKGNFVAALPSSSSAAGTLRARLRCFSPKARRECCW